MGTGVVRKAPKDAAFLDTKLNQSDIDMLQVNLRLDPGHIKEMNIDWKYEVFCAYLYLKARLIINDSSWDLLKIFKLLFKNTEMLEVFLL
jgi:hypothetical protein